VINRLKRIAGPVLCHLAYRQTAAAWRILATRSTNARRHQPALRTP